MLGMHPKTKVRRKLPSLEGVKILGAIAQSLNAKQRTAKAAVSDNAFDLET
jgi:hypothetical protein